LLARLDQLWPRVPRYKPLSVGVVLLGLVPASGHQPDLFAAGSQGHQQLSPLVDRIVSTGATGVARSASASSRPRSANSKAMPFPAGAGELGILTLPHPSIGLGVRDSATE
jgi:hypothetical protein